MADEHSTVYTVEVDANTSKAEQAVQALKGVLDRIGSDSGTGIAEGMTAAEHGIKQAGEAGHEAESKWAGARDRLGELNEKGKDLAYDVMPGLSGAVGGVSSVLGVMNTKSHDGAAALAEMSAGFATLGVSMIALDFSKFDNGLEALHNMALETGMTIPEVGGLSAAMQAAGMSGGDAARGIQRLAMQTQTLADQAAKGAVPSGAIANALKQIGVNALDAEGKARPLSELVPEIANAFKKSAEEAEANHTTFNAAGVAMQIFGRSGAALVPMLLQGADGLKQWNDLYTKLGVGSEEQVKHLEDFKKATTESKVALQALGISIGSDVAPFLTKFSMVTADAAKSLETLNPWVRDAVIGFPLLAAGVTGGIAVLMKFVDIAKGGYATLSKTAGAITGVGKAAYNAASGVALGGTSFGTLTEAATESEAIMVGNAAALQAEAAAASEAAAANAADATATEGLSAAEAGADAASVGLFASLGPVGLVLGGVAAVLGVAAIAVHHFSDEAHASKQEVADLNSELSALQGSGKTPEQLTPILQGRADAAKRSLADAQQALTDFQSRLGGASNADYFAANNKGYQQLKQSVADATAAEKFWGDQVDKNASIVRGDTQATKDLAEADKGSSEATGEQLSLFGQIGSKLSEYAQHVGVVKGSLQELADAQRDALDVSFDNSAQGQLDTLVDTAHALTQAYRDALAAQKNLFSQSSPEQDAGKAALAGMQAQLTNYKGVLDALPPSLAPVAAAQKKVDDLWQQGKQGTTEYAQALQQRALAVSAGYKSEGKAATDNAAATQQSSDALQHQVTVQTDANEKINAWRTALQTAAAAAESASPDKQHAAWQAYDNIVKQATDSLGGNASALKGDIDAVQTSRTAETQATKATTDAYDAIRTTAAERKQAAMDMKVFGDSMANAKEPGTQLANAIGKAIDAVTKDAKKMQQNVPQAVTVAIQKGQQTAQENAPIIGAALDTGISTGISTNSGVVDAAARAVVISAVKAAQSAGEISSPSQVTKRKVGQPLGQGVGEGWSATAPDVNAAATGVVKGSVAAATQAAKAGAQDPALKSAMQQMADVLTAKGDSFKLSNEMSQLTGQTGPDQERPLTQSAIDQEKAAADAMKTTATQLVQTAQDAVNAMLADAEAGNQQQFQLDKAKADSARQAADQAYQAWHTEASNTLADQKALADRQKQLESDKASAAAASAQEQPDLLKVMEPGGQNLPDRAVTQQQLDLAQASYGAAQTNALNALDALHEANQKVASDTDALQAAINSGDQAAIKSAQDQLTADQATQKQREQDFQTALAHENTWYQTVQTDTKALANQQKEANGISLTSFTDAVTKKIASIQNLTADQRKALNESLDGDSAALRSAEDRYNKIVALEQRMGNRIAEIQQELLDDNLTPDQRQRLELELQTDKSILAAADATAQGIVDNYSKVSQAAVDSADQQIQATQKALDAQAKAHAKATAAASGGGAGAGGGGGGGNASINNDVVLSRGGYGPVAADYFGTVVSFGNPPSTTPAAQQGATQLNLTIEIGGQQVGGVFQTTLYRGQRLRVNAGG